MSHRTIQALHGWAVGGEELPFLGFGWNAKMTGKVTFSKFAWFMQLAWFMQRVVVECNLNPALADSTFIMPDFTWDPVFNNTGCGLAACIRALPITGCG